MRQPIGGWPKLSVDERFWSKVCRGDGCWLWTAAKDARGYGHFKLDGVAQLAPRVAWRLSRGAIPGDMFVCHHCDNPSCVRPEHLFLGTAADNAMDRARKDRGIRGARVPVAKLTDELAEEIRAACAAQVVTQREIAERLGIHESTVNAIARGRTWRGPHLQERTP